MDFKLILSLITLINTPSLARSEWPQPDDQESHQPIAVEVPAELKCTLTYGDHEKELSTKGTIVTYPAIGQSWTSISIEEGEYIPGYKIFINALVQDKKETKSFGLSVWQSDRTTDSRIYVLNEESAKESKPVKVFGQSGDLLLKVECRL